MLLTAGKHDAYRIHMLFVLMLTLRKTLEPKIGMLLLCVPLACVHD